MDSRYTTFTLYTLGATAVVAALHATRSRLYLSLAKHRSLSGHARMARRIASLVPYYAFGEEDFFQSDGAPEVIASRRRQAFMRLAQLLSLIHI